MRRRDLLAGVPAAALLLGARRLAAAPTAPLARVTPAPDFTPAARYPELPPLAPEVFARRRAEARAETRRAGGAALLATAGASSFAWLTGARLHRSERLIALVLPVDREAILVAPAFELSRLARELPGVAARGWEEREGPLALVAAALAGRRRGRLLVEPTTEYGTALALGAALPGWRLADAGPVFETLRARKAPEELERIRRACAITEDVFATVFARLRPGLTDREIARMVDEEHRARGVEGYALVQLGPQAALPHGGTTGAVLREDTPVLFDGGCRVQGYWSDVTWSRWYGGEPSARWREIYRLVHDAQSAAIERVAPGVPAQEIDRAARRVIEKAGLGQRFTHRLGHGMGLDGHEAIYLVEGNLRPLEPGHVFSVEPGVYLEGELGVRLEDDVVCTARGAELVSRRSLALPS
jgi:Xaa-Pro dipeptidase